MNLLILSAGTRVKIVDYFKALEKGKVVCCDASLYAPALFAGDVCYQLPYITDPQYIDRVLEICAKEQIAGVLSLIDPEILLLSRNRQRFSERGITVIAPREDAVALCFDKRRMYRFCVENQIPTIPTYDTLQAFEAAYEAGEIDFPVFIKPATGSASVNIQRIADLATLKTQLTNQPDMIIQAFMDGPEYGVDVYCDLKTGELIEFFVKEKLLMRSGETDKARSIAPDLVRELLTDFIAKTDFRGPIDIDLFYHQGRWLISEVNPRFGGGYPFAQTCGADFPRWIANNLEGQENQRQELNYPLNQYLMKYSEIMQVSEETLAQKGLQRATAEC